ncbi:response regulator [Marinobacteraceae bacterium S3BR75-40.1]
MNYNAVPILMAEDDAMDRMLTKEALEESRLANPIYFVEDGEQLMRYLRREPPYTDPTEYPYPGVILLDLNMPKMDGRACLRAIRKDPNLKHLPVIVMTTSTQEEEVFRSYGLGANSFICKPIEFEKLVDVMRSFGKYWFTIVDLPHEPE